MDPTSNTGSANDNLDEYPVEYLISLDMPVLHADLRVFGLGVWSSSGLGFSEQVTVLTLLSCPVVELGQRVHHRA